MNKKEAIPKVVYKICKSKNNFVFHNHLVKEVNFSIYQLYHSFLHAHNANQPTELKDKVHEVFATAYQLINQNNS